METALLWIYTVCSEVYSDCDGSVLCSLLNCTTNASGKGPRFHLVPVTSSGVGNIEIVSRVSERMERWGGVIPLSGGGSSSLRAKRTWILKRLFWDPLTKISAFSANRRTNAKIDVSRRSNCSAPMVLRFDQQIKKLENEEVPSFCWQRDRRTLSCCTASYEPRRPTSRVRHSLPVDAARSDRQERHRSLAQGCSPRVFEIVDILLRSLRKSLPRQLPRGRPAPHSESALI